MTGMVIFFRYHGNDFLEVDHQGVGKGNCLGYQHAPGRYVLKWITLSAVIDHESAPFGETRLTGTPENHKILANLPSAAFGKDRLNNLVIEHAPLGKVQNIHPVTHQLNEREHILDLLTGNPDHGRIVRSADNFEKLLHLVDAGI